MTRISFIIGSLLGACSAALDAIGAHGAAIFMREQQPIWIGQAARSKMSHALAILLAAWALTRWTGRTGLWTAAGWSFATGIPLLSGSLRSMAFSDPRLGRATPKSGAAL